MNRFEVPEPILCSPYEEPSEHWYLKEGELPEQRPGRRPAMYFYRPPERSDKAAMEEGAGTAIELKLVNRIRERLKAWRVEGWPGVTRTTLELLTYWRREGRQQRLFFAQLEAAETLLFLIEARDDLLQGIEISLDEPSAERQANGYAAFRRYGCKMATGSGKTTVMAMLAAWSILNKVHDRSDGRFADAVVVVCPNVTIRNRLAELDPQAGEASLYRTRDLVPPHLMPQLIRGRVMITNWHVFEPKVVQAGGVSAKVVKAGRPVRVVETIHIGPRTTTARGRRYVSLDDLELQKAAGMLTVTKRYTDRQGNLKWVVAESMKYVESDHALVHRVLGREIGAKRNVLVLNDEAHHAYRIATDDRGSVDDAVDEDDIDEFVREASVWVEGLDRIHKVRGINFCVDLSATPYYLTRAGRATNRVFPWVVSDFGLTDAIESGLVKIPQLAVRDTTGSEIPGYFNIWRWILPKLTSAEKGGKKGSPKPEAILKYAAMPIVMLGGLWEETLRAWQGADPRPPVFILVCKNTRIAKVVYEWLAEDKPPAGVPPARLDALRNRDGDVRTLRIDSKVVQETDSGQVKSDEMRWLRLTLDTVGQTDWPRDRQARPLYPEGFEELARKLGRPLQPPGRDVRCIVSVGMLTEGWDCKTVTHVVGLRPFMSQLLCEQVVGRALRRSSYEVDENGRFTEEVAKIFGVPFEVIPFKENPTGPAPRPPERAHVHAVPEKSRFRIRFPRVEGYQQEVRNRVSVDWSAIAPLRLDPLRIPPEVEMKASLPANSGRPSLAGPGRLEHVSLSPYRAGRRRQALTFELARDLVRTFVGQPGCDVPVHVLMPQMVRIVEKYLREKVVARPPAEIVDAFLSPYYGWMMERLLEEIKPDAAHGEAPEVPRYEKNRGPGSTDEVDFWTRRDVREVVRSHLNYVVADTRQWEQSAAYYIDRHPVVDAFVKNSGLGFAIPYLHNGQPHDYLPDFLIRLKGGQDRHLVLEVKGYDELREVKAQAARRWADAVNADGRYGSWSYALVDRVDEIDHLLSTVAVSGSGS